MATRIPTDKPEIETTGHEWDGITELDTPMPRWWLWTFYACIIWGVGYMIAYPAWPLINGATKGVLGYSSRAEVAQTLADVKAERAPLDNRIVAAELAELLDDPELRGYAVSGGAAVFKTFCSQCHGAGGAGVQAAGYPNLLDDDWLWGGTVADIYWTISHGVRWEDDEDTRFSQMPAFGEFMEDEEIAILAQFVLSLSGQPHDAAIAAAAAPLFEENCASCHGEDGTGDREQGAPNLTDAIWLFGSDPERITANITRGPGGIMPPWTTKLSEAEIREVAVYVHELGGGE